jgi:hypothetical protein
MAGGKADKAKGNLLMSFTTKLMKALSINPYAKTCVDYIMSDKWTRVNQIDKAITFLKEEIKNKGASYTIDDTVFSEVTGVGINLSK